MEIYLKNYKTVYKTYKTNKHFQISTKHQALSKSVQQIIINIYKQWENYLTIIAFCVTNVYI
jgi:hypothetical protein